MPLFSTQPTPWVLANEGNIYTLSNSGVLTASASLCFLVSIPPLQVNVTVTRMKSRLALGGNGHIDLGIYDTSFNLLGHIGSTVTATGMVDQPMLANVPLAPGNYFLGVWLDNVVDQI